MSEKTEREVFEAWATDYGCDIARSGTFPSSPYLNDYVDDMWDGWQARAALTSGNALGELSDEAVHYVLRQYFDGVTAEKAGDIAHDLRIGLGAALAPVAAPASKPCQYPNCGCDSRAKCKSLFNGAPESAPASGEAGAHPGDMTPAFNASGLSPTYAHRLAFSEGFKAGWTSRTAHIAADHIEDASGMVTDAMVYAFHRATTDGPLGEADFNEIRDALQAALLVTPIAESLQGDTAGASGTVWHEHIDKDGSPYWLHTPPAASSDDARDAARWRFWKEWWMTEDSSDECMHLPGNVISALEDMHLDEAMDFSIDAAQRAGNQGESNG